MTFLKDHLVPLLVAASLLMAVGTVTGWTNAAHHRGVAEATAEEKERAMRQAKANAARATEAAQRAAEAERETQRVRERMGARISQLTAQLTDLGQTNAVLEAAAEAEIREHDGWVTEATYRERVGALERTVAVTDSLRATENAQKDAVIEAQDREISALKVHVGTLLAQVSTLEDIVDTQEREIEARIAADRAGSILPDFGDLTKPIYVAAGALIGWGGAKLTESEAQR